jgi:diaminohydroxyphosphoribosylaminopyrimidine deaminase/5-amino-6-(5-phosphoribosylamino)uracil reductase
MADPNPQVAGSGHWQLADKGVTVEVGVGADEARRAHAGHIRRMIDGRPHTILKLAVSADGKAGLAGRRPAVITGEASRDRVHAMRATSDALLTGIGTAIADDPLLTCRLPGMAGCSPVRVVLDGQLRLPLDGKLVGSAREVPLWVVTSDSAPQDRERALQACGPRCCAFDRRATGCSISARYYRRWPGGDHAADDRGRADRIGGVRQGRSR